MLHPEPPCQFPRASQNCSCSEVRIFQGSRGRLAVLFTCQEQVGRNSFSSLDDSASLKINR